MRATPGPWEVQDGNVYDAADKRVAMLTAQDGERRPFRMSLIALVYERYGIDGEKPTEGGNARLVAAAPELLAMVKSLFKLALVNTLEDLETLDDARALLRHLEDGA